MGTRIGEVLKNKKRLEKSQRAKRNAEMNQMKQSQMYKASLVNGLAEVNGLLDSDEINGVIVQIPDKYLARFSEAIYDSELAEYEVMQLEADTFLLRYKIV